jgi:ribosomal protein S18 acetylase RimI-like enzyme
MTQQQAYEIHELIEDDLLQLKSFTDSEIGAGYYSAGELGEIFEKSQLGGRTASLVLKRQDQICGVRLSYPHGRSHGKGRGLSPRSWPYPQSETAYFQSLFLAPEVQAAGWGVKLSQASAEILRKMGACGILCHSWKESPHNSSRRYLDKMGFELIAEHPLYWQHVNYNCPRCLTPPCQCTAQEMYLRLENG